MVSMHPRENPGYLKLDLYCKGARLDESCFIEQHGGRKIMRSRAGLGSGLEAILPDNLWTNIPVAEEFTQKSPYIVKQEEGKYKVYRDDEFIANIKLAPQPSWYESKTTLGKTMRSIGSLQGTYLGIYPAKVCEYWVQNSDHPVKDNCKFCSVGLNLGVDDAEEKTVNEVLEVVHKAWRESKITYVDFNTGHYTGYNYLDIVEPFIKRIKAETDLLIGLQTPPHPDLERYKHLKKIGVNRVSFCFELFNRECFREVCPGKDRQYGLDTYLNAVKYCAGLSDFSKMTLEPWVTNGEIIAGLEPPEDSIKAIDWITENGAIPTVCVFRPLKGTDYENVAAPKTEDMVPIFRRMYEACMERNLPIGLAPNIHVSLVLLPEEGRYFVEDPAKYKRQERKLGFKKWGFAAAYYTRRALKRTKAPAATQ